MTVPVVLLSVVTGALAPHPAHAQSEADRATARELAAEGQSAFERGDYATAADRFARAHALVAAPTLLLALARAQARQGKLVAAHESYARIAREGVAPGASALFRRAVEEAAEEQRVLKARLAWLVVQAPGDEGAVVTLDGTPIPRAALGVRRAVDPGERVLVATAPGKATVERKVQLAEGAVVEVTLELLPAADAAPARDEDSAPREPLPHATTPAADAPRDRTLAWVALGVGAAGVVLGSVAGGLALGKRSELEDQCPGSRCPEGARATLDGYRQMGTLSTVGFLVGGVGLAAGVGLWLLAPTERDQVALSPLGLRWERRF